MVRLTEADDARLTLVVASGDLQPAEVVLALSTAVEAHAQRPVMWDMTAARLSSLSSDDVRRVAQQALGSLATLCACGQAALVCSEDADFGVARMLATYVSLEGCPLQIGVFRGTDEAKRWLLGGG